MAPLVIALPSHRARSRRSLSRRPVVRRRAVSASSPSSRSSVPSSFSITSAIPEGDTNMTLNFKRNITIDLHTGSEHNSFSEEEEDSGVQVSSRSGSHEDVYSDEEDEDDWDYIDE